MYRNTYAEINIDNLQNNVKQISQNVEEKQNITITNEQTNTNNQLNEEINSIINEL